MRRTAGTLFGPRRVGHASSIVPLVPLPVAVKPRNHDASPQPSCYVLAARMGYNGAYVAGLVTLSTLLGLASLPFALGFLRGLVVTA